MRKFKLPEFNIMSKKFVFFGISLAIILAGVVSIFLQGFSSDFDFTSGTQIEVIMGDEFDNKKLADFIEKTLGKKPTVTIGRENDTHAIIKTIPLSSEAKQDFYEAFGKEYKIEDMEKAIVSSTSFSPTIGADMQQKILVVTMVVIITVLLFVATRLELGMAVSILLVLLHDVLIIFAAFSLFRIPMNNSFVAILLATIGFSVASNISLFDKIKTDLTKVKKGEGYSETANRSIWQTMCRTLNTSCMVLLLLLSLLILGAAAIKAFAASLIIGVIVTTYSSIFLAAPISTMFYKKGKK